MNRTIRLLFLSVSLLASVPAFSYETTFDGKLGGAWAFYPEMPGLNINADYQWILDPYFSAGAESGLFWVQWDETRGKELRGQTITDVKATTNAYAVPVLAIAQVRLPNIKEKFSVLPYATVGLGYSFMPVTYSDPAYTDPDGVSHKARNKFYFHTGFTWKVAAGAAYSPSGSKIAFLGEAGYVGAHLYSGNNDLDMSRMFIDIGVRFSFGQ